MRKYLFAILAIMGFAATAFGQGNSYQPQLITYQGPPPSQAVCDVYQVALDVTRGTFYSCAPRTRKWTTSGSIISTVASLPLASSVPTYTAAEVTDGSSSSDCTVGGGSNVVLCYSNGSAWTLLVAVGPAGPTGPQGPTGPTGATGPTGSISATSGPSPWTDVLAFTGGREISNSGYSTTANCTATSTTVTLAAASVFQNGDGISLYGCGITNTLSTPTAPAVTGGISSGPTSAGLIVAGPASCATSRSYKLFAIGSYSTTAASNFWGAYTAASTAGTTTAGCATLGPVNVTITSIGASDVNGLRTVTCAATCAVSAGAYVETASTSDTLHTDGHWQVSSVTDTTHFKIVTPLRNDSNTSTGGTLYWFNEDEVTIPTGVSNVYQYGICDNAGNILGLSLPGLSFWEYYGSTNSGGFQKYPWLPSTCPSAAANAVLTTTVSAGGGTTTLTVGTAAGNNATGGYATFDEVPALIAATTASNFTSPLFLPSIDPHKYHVIGSYWNTSQGLCCGFSPVVYQSGNILADAPIEWDSGMAWNGRFSGMSGFSPQQGFLGAPIDCQFATAPCVNVNGSNGLDVERVKFELSANQNDVTLVYLHGGSVANFNDTTFNTENGNGTDYNSIGLFSNSDPFVRVDGGSFLSGPSQVAGTSNTPTALFFGNGGQYSMSNLQVNRRGFASVNGSHAMLISGGSNKWIQGPIQPLYTVANSSPCSLSLGGIDIENVNMDTSGQPIFVSVCNSGGLFNGDITLRANNPSGAHPWVTGDGALLIHAQGIPSNQALGQNFDFIIESTDTAPALNPSTISAAGQLSALTGTGACVTGSLASQKGGLWAGQVTCGSTTGASTLVITPGVTAPNGWSCWASDLTTAANILRQSATGTGSCTIAGTVNANDVVTFGAIGY